MVAIATILVGLANILGQCSHYFAFNFESKKGKNLYVSISHRRRKALSTQTTKIISVTFAGKVSTVHKLNSGHNLFRWQRETFGFQLCINFF